MRHLFTQAIGLRLRDREEVAMVLGDGAVAAGARHKIPAPPRVSATSSVRTTIRSGSAPATCPTTMIRRCAATFPAANPRPVGPTVEGEPPAGPAAPPPGPPRPACPRLAKTLDRESAEGVRVL